MPKETLTVADTLEMLKHVADSVIAAEPQLTDADRNIGDGDHGLGMQRGMTAVLEKLDSSTFATISDLFGVIGMTMMSSMGGASGALFGTLFRNGGKALTDSAEFDAHGLAAFLRAANEGIKTRGGAKPGDKTMIDALEPAAIEAENVSDLSLHLALKNVASASEKGRDDSEKMIAVMGRAKTLGEKTIGHPDAGACSVAIILRAMADFTEN